ncbi:MAG: secondary thiamine-phosphate synthase enzyme YjbQ [Anaerolineales bacterium]|jgi:secondary thiamine-phosphate synthase enzyme|nr:secondary thiamine-phosphate synthase enzyme YjbQ [Anaerolineales bacterium]
MNWYKDTLTVVSRGKGLYAFTRMVEERIRQWDIVEGMCFLYIPHTSASLVISESYDPTAKADLETFMEHLAPEGQAWYEHRLEGADDSPSHLRAMLTQTSLTIPIDDRRLSLGTWQGVYLFEHRRAGQHRQIFLRCLKIS